MTKPTAPAAAPMTELSLDALDTVMGGNSAAPMGLGGSLAAPLPALTIGAHTASTGHSSPTGYNDHFGLHFGGPAASENPASSAHSSAQSSQSSSSTDSHMPMGLGGSMPSGAPVNGSSHDGGASSTSASSSSSADAGHAPTQQGGGHDGHDPFGAQPAQGSANDHAPDQLGVNAASAFQLLDEAAQDAGHEASPAALADDHS